MSRRRNAVAAVAAFAGLMLLAPVTSGSPQSASEQKKEQKKKGQACECVVMPDADFVLRIPEVVVPRIVAPDVERIVRGYADFHRGMAWQALDGERLASAIRAQVAGQREDWSRYAREMAEQARVWTQQAGQNGTAIFMEDGQSGWLGVSISEVTAEKAKELKLPAERGVLVSDVEPDSAAAKAGIKDGDVITEFNGQRVEGTAQFRRMVRETLAGRSVPVSIWREGRSQSLQVTLGNRGEQLRGRIQERIHVVPEWRMEGLPRMELFASRTPTLGISGEDLDGGLGAYFGAPDGEGVLVREVHSGTPAEKAGFKAGDVITRVDGDRIKTVSDLRAKMREKRESKAVKVDILRRGSAMTLEVEIEQPKPPTPRMMSRRVSA